MDIPILDLVWLIPCYPLIGAILASPWYLGWSGQLGTRPAGYVNILMAGVAFIHAVSALVTGWDLPTQKLPLVAAY